MHQAHPLAADLDAAVERAEHALRPLAGQRLFLTGGTGFVGSWLLELLAWANFRLRLDLRLTILTRKPEHFAQAMPHISAETNVEIVNGDIREFAYPSGTFAAVIHGAASSDNAWNTSHPSEAVETIVSGTLRTLRFAEESGARRLLFLSSGAVYGRQLGRLPVSEEHPGAPVIAGTADSAYGEAKRTAEVLALLYGERGLDVIRARIFSAYGPYLPLSTHFAIGNFIRDALLGRPVTVRGDGSPVRSYAYGADLAVGLLSCLTRGVPGHAYNIGGDEPTSLGELAQLVAALSNPPVPVRFLDEPVSSDWLVPDISRARDELGFTPCVTLEQGIAATMGWARKRHVVS